MSYVISRFEDTILPTYNAETDAGTGQAEDLLLGIPGGSYDAQGGDQARQRPGIVTKRFMPVAGADTAAAMTSLVQDLRGLLGKRARLYRTWPDGQVEWCWARLQRLSGNRGARHYFTDVTAEWQRISPNWYGNYVGAWVLDDGITLDAGYYLDSDEVSSTLPIDLVVPNEGNAPVDNLILTITSVGTAITSLDVSQGVIEAGPHVAHFVWTGTLAVGNSLVIDCGAQSIKNNGVDAYSGLVFQADHAIDGWLRIPAGGGQIEFIVTGQGTAAAGLWYTWQ